MIKRIILKIENNNVTTKIAAMMPTYSGEENISIGYKSIKDSSGLDTIAIIRNIYLDVIGSEVDLSEITAFKDCYIKGLTKIIDLKTDKLLDDGFVWNNVKFSMAPMYYNDYRDTVTYLKSGVLQYPYTIMGKDKQNAILTAENVDSFFNTGLAFKETTYTNAWNICESLKTKTELELLNFIDPRIL